MDFAILSSSFDLSCLYAFFARLYSNLHVSKSTPFLLMEESVLKVVSCGILFMVVEVNIAVTNSYQTTTFIHSLLRFNTYSVEVVPPTSINQHICTHRATFVTQYLLKMGGCEELCTIPWTDENEVARVSSMFQIYDSKI